MNPGDRYRDIFTGTTVRVLDTNAARVKMLTEAGNVEWIDVRDFHARYKSALRRTPCSTSTSTPPGGPDGAATQTGMYDRD